MSSVVLWNCETTGVTASWNKQGAKYTCFVPTHESSEFPGVWEGVTTTHTTSEQAIEVAKRTSAAIVEERKSKPSSKMH